MVLTHDGKRFVLVTRFSERHLPKSMGFLWDPECRCWWTPDPTRCFGVAMHADRAASERLEEAANRIQESYRTSSGLEVPAPAGLRYLPYQLAAVETMASRKSVLLADEMGLGKTIEAIGAVNLLESRGERVSPCLIVCPACVKLNWVRELRKWLVRPHRVDCLGSGSEFPSDPDFVVLNYDLLERHSDRLRSIEWSILIADEAHYLKNPRAKRTRVVVGCETEGSWQPGIRAHRKVFLTGTPILNRPLEVWTIVRYLDPDSYPSFWEFARSYIEIEQNRWGTDFSKGKNLDQLGERLRATVMVRRTKADVLPGLPVKIRQVIELDGDCRESVVREESSRLRRSMWQVDRSRLMAKVLRSSGNREIWKLWLGRLRSSKNVLYGSVTEARMMVARAKLPMVVEHLRLCLESSPKVVCWAHHHLMIDGIVSEFGDRSVRLDGRMGHVARQDAVERFRSDPSVRLLVASITAAGVGIDLSVSSHVVFAELDWVPARVVQAEDRSHRIGTSRGVLVQYLVFPQAVEHAVAESLYRKQELFDGVMLDRTVDSGGRTDEDDGGISCWIRPRFELEPGLVMSVRRAMAEALSRVGDADGYVHLVRWLSENFSSLEHIPAAVDVLDRCRPDGHRSDLAAVLEAVYLTGDTSPGERVQGISPGGSVTGMSESGFVPCIACREETDGKLV